MRTNIMKRNPILLWKKHLPILFIFSMLAIRAGAEESNAITFTGIPGQLQIAIAHHPFATYVYQDDAIPRPYFCNVHAQSGVPVTRTHPPREGIDSTDHEPFHPGLWLAFGDLSGSDFWRNRAETRHIQFIEEPHVRPDGSARFAVLNHYLAAPGGTMICREECQYTILVQPEGIRMIWKSRFSSDTVFTLGDQEEMGLGVRMATPLTVKEGGTILNREGKRNEKEVWGRASDWCDYSKEIDGETVGLLLMPSPGNFRRSWFHARDYGLLVANPFGRKAFNQGESSRIVVPEGETFPFTFGLFIHNFHGEPKETLEQAYQDFLVLLKEHE